MYSIAMKGLPQAARGPRLPHEALAQLIVGELAPQELDRHLPVDLRIDGQEERSHAALCQPLNDPIAANRFWRRCHGHCRASQ
jgi:hypothetical protein